MGDPMEVVEEIPLSGDTTGTVLGGGGSEDAAGTSAAVDGPSYVAFVCLFRHPHKPAVSGVNC